MDTRGIGIYSMDVILFPKFVTWQTMAHFVVKDTVVPREIHRPCRVVFSHHKSWLFTMGTPVLRKRAFLYHFCLPLVMPPTSTKLILVSGCAFVRLSVCQEPRMIGFMDSSWKNSWHTFFFLSELSPFLEL